ncbi:MAG: lipase family protein [Cupriavidus sp.]|nr:lipase family protein [Cupriavidus sp.]
MATPSDGFLTTTIGVNATDVAEYGLLIADVFNAYAKNPAATQPPALNNSLFNALQNNNAVIGYLVAQDAVASLTGDRQLSPRQACYGALMKLRDMYVIAIRGTANIREWVIDAECNLVNHPTSGRVEEGFWSVYATMKYVPATQDAALPAIDALAEVIGTGSVMITGHSLGATIAEYLAFDLTQKLAKNTVTACFFASPRPGDGAFADAFAQVFQNQGGKYAVINSKADVVPDLPPSANGFSALPVVLGLEDDTIDPTMTVRDDLLCNHHVVCYAAMLSSGAAQQYASDSGSSATWASLLQANGDQANCLASTPDIGDDGRGG